MSEWTRPPRLRAGERVRLSLEGPVYEVRRVNDCAAYLARRVERTITVTDPRTGEVREKVVASTRVEPVSPYAFVYREEA